MKVIAKSIEMISYTDKDGILKPIKFRIESEDKTYKVIKVDNIIHTELEKLAGNKMYKFRCQSIINGTEKVFELSYEIDSCKWMLFKI